MGRKKHALNDDYASSSDEDQPREKSRDDSFADPMHQRKRKHAKDEAIYGSFYDWGSDEDEAKQKSNRRSGRSREFAFVSASSSAPSSKDPKHPRVRSSHADESMSGSDSERGDNNDDDDIGDSRRNSDDMDSDGRAEDRDIEMEEVGDEDEDDEDEDERAARKAREAAFKEKRQREQAELDTYEDKPQKQRPQMGMAHTNNLMQPPLQHRPNPIASRNFSPATSSPQSDSPVTTPVKVSKDYGSFSAKGSGFGLKMLERMGWKKGYGLGSGGSGIVEPIETKQRPVKMGIGFGGFKEKTAQTVAEEKRRGLPVSSDEDEEPEPQAKGKGKNKGKGKGDISTPADGWKQAASRKSARTGPRIEYKTATEIQQEIESGDLPMAPAQTQKIIDMTGKTVRELSSMSQISSAIARSDERFPELRHNLELMADISTTDLEQLARKQKTDHIRQQTLEKDGQRIQHLVTQDETNIERLVKAMSIADQCQKIANEVKEATSDTTGVPAVEIKEDYLAMAFKEPFDLFSGLYFEEYKLYELDQIVMASIQESFKRLLKDWDVLSTPTLGAGLFKKWQKLLRTSRVVYEDTRGPVYDARDGASLFGGHKQQQHEAMSAYESLLNQHWLPKVRSALNNRWDPRDCDSVIELLEAWAPPLLPMFIQDNIVTQLIMPKLQKQVDQWTPRDELMLHTWIHPWLPVLGQARLEQELFAEVRRKLATGLTSWSALDPSGLQVLDPWRGVFDPTDMEILLLKSVLPKLVEALQALEINPRDQHLEILQAVLPWHIFFPSTTFSSLLLNEFFPKWHRVLYLWLTHPESSSNTDLQVSQWYHWWKRLFPQEVLQEPAVAAGFRQGLDMINQFMAGLEIRSPAETKKHLATSVSFKDLVQDYATQNSLLFVLTRQIHDRSGRPLYRLGGNSTGTAGGILVHMTDEVAFVKSEETGAWAPIGLEELMILAGAGKGQPRTETNSSSHPRRSS
ncbi:hypothetical protein BGW38_000168 [Lunasporangiospora selenospora]|uniref:G-patch domain-containing protein n=1 Tax=Lunasporangiospora selenospora TaxID=979761 RepID=A0A9P6KIE9_9FUNG|nr:hypothetical protein BGW38_000168 [Lunasporangiospora selenospora]